MPRLSKPHSGRLRVGRYSAPHQLYLLTATTHDRRPIFTDFTCARLLVTELRQAQCDGLVESLAWVVMPDHVHWLVSLRSGSLAQLMQRVKGRSARQLNLQLEQSGTIWQSGFHDRALRREDAVQAVARYIVVNPLRAGLVQRIGDYPFWDAVWL
ncbi:transposase [Pseudomonas sp. zbq_18]|uniref:REP-associated tyrosine transposase n=1 Tax=Pseudomonadota TaxID=1224 RepID=UPI00370A5FAF